MLYALCSMRFALLSKLKIFLLEKLHTRIYHICIVQYSPVLRNFLYGHVAAQGWPVRSMRGHCLYYVCHSQSLSLDYYVVAGETNGIARAINPLMMLKHY